MYLQTVTQICTIYEWLWVLDSLHCYDVSTGIYCHPHSETESNDGPTHLDVLSLSLIIQNMCNLLSKDLLSSGSSMDAHHGHSNRPGSVAYGHPEVDVIGLHVLSLQELATDVREEGEDVSCYGLGGRELLHTTLGTRRLTFQSSNRYNIASVLIATRVYEGF